MSGRDDGLADEAISQGGDAEAEGEQRMKISRREFARRAAVASALVSMAPVQLGAAGNSETLNEKSAATERSRAAGASAAEQEANAPKLSPEGKTEAEARYQTIMNQYGRRFSEEQKADIHRLCLLAQPPIDRLRAYAVENGDAPALYLKPLMEREKKAVAVPGAAKSANAGAAKRP